MARGRWRAGKRGAGPRLADATLSWRAKLRGWPTARSSSTSLQPRGARGSLSELEECGRNTRPPSVAGGSACARPRSQLLGLKLALECTGSHTWSITATSLLSRSPRI
ncbi:hypothetical protein MTO96_023356 [Rhipicephalus appendiculatus]